MITGNPHKHNNYLHYHDGSTCHGFPTIKMCLENAIDKGWVGKVLKKTDKTNDKISKDCYSLISGSFEHWEQYGEFVAELKITVVHFRRAD